MSRGSAYAPATQGRTATAKPKAPRLRTLRRLLADPVAVGCIVCLTVILLAAVFAPLLVHAGPNASSLADVLALPSPAHPLGGDGVGRDVLARLLYGTRTSLLGAAIAVVVALAVGVPNGLLAGFYLGWFDALAKGLFSVILATPAIIVLLLVLIAFGNGIYLAMAVAGILLAPNVFRLVRASVAAVRSALYVDAARVSGLSDARILSRHVLRVTLAPIIIQSAQLFGIGVTIQSGLEFLGMGGWETPSWGNMLNDGFSNMYLRPMLLVWPATAIVLTVVSTALLASALRDALQSQTAPAADPQPEATDKAEVSEAQVRPSGSIAAQQPLLSVSGLRVRYGDREVVHGVSFDVAPGETVALVGESGSGKSQCAFSILGLLPDQGRCEADVLSFDGRDLRGASKRGMKALRGRRIGYIPQEPISNLDPAYTVGTQLLEPIRLHMGMSKGRALEHARTLLVQVGIPDPERVLASYPHQISGGMAQRVLIAGAIACEPELLIADEPTTAIDVTVQAEILELLGRLRMERKMALLIITHDFGVVADLSDRVVVLKRGEVVESGNVAEIFAAPRHAYTRKLLASTLIDAPMRDPLPDTAHAQ